MQYCNGIDYIDLIQEGWIGLIEAVKRYDNMKEVKYSTYAYYWVNKYILQALGKDIKTHQSEGQYDQEIFADSVEKVAHVSKEFEELGEQEQEILELYAEGYSIREIARQDGIKIKKSRIHEILQGIKNQTGQNATKSV